jgi:hypothetical protein
MKQIPGWIAALALFAGPVFAGGFWLTLERPANESDAAAVVRVIGCHNPQDAQVAGMAEGLVRGKRESVPIKLRSTGRTGVYEIERPRLEPGAWVFAVTARLDKSLTSELAPLAADGKLAPLAERSTVEKPGRYANRAILPADIDAVLARLVPQ